MQYYIIRYKEVMKRFDCDPNDDNTEQYTIEGTYNLFINLFINHFISDL